MADKRYFPRCADDDFWLDRERVKTLIDLYEEHECLWNSKCADYKVLAKKKAAKSKIGTFFGMTGKHFRTVSYYTGMQSYLQVSIGPLVLSSPS